MKPRESYTYIQNQRAGFQQIPKWTLQGDTCSQDEGATGFHKTGYPPAHGGNVLSEPPFFTPSWFRSSWGHWAPVLHRNPLPTRGYLCLLALPSSIWPWRRRSTTQLCGLCESQRRKNSSLKGRDSCPRVSVGQHQKSALSVYLQWTQLPRGRLLPSLQIWGQMDYRLMDHLRQTSAVHTYGLFITKAVKETTATWSSETPVRTTPENC